MVVTQPRNRENRKKYGTNLNRAKRKRVWRKKLFWDACYKNTEINIFYLQEALKLKLLKLEAL